MNLSDKEYLTVQINLFIKNKGLSPLTDTNFYVIFFALTWWIKDKMYLQFIKSLLQDFFFNF
jgi:hypothetical protein